MATITAISDTLLAIDNAAHHGVYRGTEECIAGVWKRTESERIKYINLPPEMEMVGAGAAADAAWWAAEHRATDQDSPLGESWFDEADQYITVRRETHTCPWTGGTWIVESTKGYPV